MDLEPEWRRNLEGRCLAGDAEKDGKSSVPENRREKERFFSINSAGCSSLKKFGDARLRKNQRLKSAADFEYVKANGEKKIGRYLILLIASPRLEVIRCGFICSKKFDKKAVVRNRAKRLMKEVFRNTKSVLAPCEIIFIPKRNILQAEIWDIQEEFIRLVKESGKWNGQ